MKREFDADFEGITFPDTGDRSMDEIKDAVGWKPVVLGLLAALFAIMAVVVYFVLLFGGMAILVATAIGYAPLAVSHTMALLIGILVLVLLLAG